MFKKDYERAAINAMISTMKFFPIAFATLPIFSTLIGGLAVYRWKKDLHPWLSLSGGILLGVAFLDLLPEAIDRGFVAHASARWILAAALLAILLFHLLDKLLSFHAHHHHVNGNESETCENHRHVSTKAFIRAGSMIFHSLLDGIAIGAGFAADARLGLLVTLAVIMHDFSDGMSTVTMLKASLGPSASATLPLLAADAFAPFAGSFLGMWFGLNDLTIAFLLAAFSGFFIFLALSDLLPQAHAGAMSRRFGLFLTALGIAAVAFIQTTATI